jgi:hypothetical protein
MEVDTVPETSVVKNPVPAAVAESTALPGQARPNFTEPKPVNGAVHDTGTSTSTVVAVSPSPVPIPLIAPQTNPAANAPSNGPTSWAALRERNGERHMAAN